MPGVLRGQMEPRVSQPPHTHILTGTHKHTHTHTRAHTLIVFINSSELSISRASTLLLTVSVLWEPLSHRGLDAR